MNETARNDGRCPVTASVSAHLVDPMPALAAALGPGPFAQVFLFVSPEADMAALAARAKQVLPQTPVCGCSTAGEITGAGYEEGQIVAFALPRASFEVETVVIEGIDAFDPRHAIADVLHARQSLNRRAFERMHECAVLLVDGLSGQEDALVAALAGGLGPVPIVGGSAGDGTRFKKTRLMVQGKVLENAAVLCLLRSDCRVRPFSLDHLRPTQARMVVTRANATHRIVERINDDPAAPEYARLLGLRPEQLSPFVFAAHPVLVRAGGRHHVRAIQHVTDTGGLVFFAAIDEGLVLTIAEPQDIAGHLREELGLLSREATPSAILGFDCIFRRIEAEGRQMTRELSEILSQNRVVGFSTYGEQIGGMHVNQTMTGLAFYPPESAS